MEQIQEPDDILWTLDEFLQEEYDLENPGMGALAKIALD